MKEIKNWLESPEFEKGVDLLDKHTHYRNMVRIMRNSGETDSHMETLKYELGKLVPAEEIIQFENGSEMRFVSTDGNAGAQAISTDFIFDPAQTEQSPEETEEGKKQAEARVETVLNQAQLLCKTLYLTKMTK